MNENNNWPQPGHKWEERMREIDEWSRPIPYLAQWRFNWTDGTPSLNTKFPGTIQIVSLLDHDIGQ